MVTTKKNVLTPCGFARLLTRGIRANFAPEHRQAETERLVEYLQELAMSRAADAELAGCKSADATQAKRDANWFEAIAGELEGMCPGSPLSPGCEFCRGVTNRPNDPTWQCPYCGKKYDAQA